MRGAGVSVAGRVGCGADVRVGGQVGYGQVRWVWGEWVWDAGCVCSLSRGWGKRGGDELLPHHILQARDELLARWLRNLL
eukprot:scaffold20004_cov128-Isochrysis_galbana.AAC.2